MDPHGHNPPPPRPMMMARGGLPLPYGAVQYQPNPMAGNQIPGSIGGVIPSSTLANSQLAQSANNQLTEQQAAAYQELQQQQQQQQQLQLQLQEFWANQRQEINETVEFKNYSLPLARIKKIMKADEDVRMISAEAPVVFARACEMFILELTMRAWSHTEENKRRTLQRNDIIAAISRTEVLDFLIENNPRVDRGEVVQSSPLPSIPGRGAVPIVGPADPLPPCWNIPPQHHLPPVGIPGMTMGSPMPDPTGMYAFQSPVNPYLAQQMWQPPPDQQQLPPDL